MRDPDYNLRYIPSFRDVGRSGSVSDGSAIGGSGAGLAALGLGALQ